MTEVKSITGFKPLIYDLVFSQLSETFSSWGESPYRTKQVWHAIYQQLIDNPEDITTLPHSLRKRLSDNFSFHNLKPVETLHSKDSNTEKNLFLLPDGNPIETVLMRYLKRKTLCISSQSGCGMGCKFCATGQMGLYRNLSSGEIVEQVLFYARQLKERDEHITNIVVMGMGEPFHNYEATMQAIDILNHSSGFKFGARRITISTVGIIPAIYKFTKERRQVNLAISLHAVDDNLRSALIPINRKFPVNELLVACKHYVAETKRRITFEWALIDGINDTIQHASELAAKLRLFRMRRAMLCHVNVIPLNPTPGFLGKSTGKRAANDFCNALMEMGIPCTLRLRRGIEISAGCGQLATRSHKQIN
jgi:23S rRNA (adenine2503-C2)-methyltransferase